MNVLFVCTGNTCRSPMAAALFNKIACEEGLDVRIESAGIFAADGDAASKQAMEAVKAYGTDLSYHRAKMLNSELFSQAELVIAATESHKKMIEDLYGKCVTFDEISGVGDIKDPYGGTADDYKDCCEQILKGLYRLAERIKSGDFDANQVQKND